MTVESDHSALKITNQQLCDVLKHQKIKVDHLAGDGSDRVYFRITCLENDKTWVLMQLASKNPEGFHKDSKDWLELLKKLTNYKIPCPVVHHILPNHSCLIINDCGDEMLESKVLTCLNAGEKKSILKLYEQAFNFIIKFFHIKEDENGNDIWAKRSFDLDKLSSELIFFKKHFLIKKDGLLLSKKESILFEKDINALCLFLAKRPTFFAHRDYHSRNLMFKNNKLELIDFQDARLGPAAYDLVSLCFDSYVPLTYTLRKTLLQQAIDLLYDKVSPEIANEIHATWKACLLQRQLKALGSFAYLTYEKKRGNYLKYVSPALDTLQETRDKRWDFISNALIDKIRQAYK